MIYIKENARSLLATLFDANAPVLELTGHYREAFLKLQNGTDISAAPTGVLNSTLEEFYQSLEQHSLLPTGMTLEAARALWVEFNERDFGNSTYAFIEDTLPVYAVPASGVESPYTMCYPDEPPLTGMCK